MTIDVGTKLVNLDGGNVKDGDKDATFKMVVINCLGIMEVRNGADAVRVWDLGLRLNKADGDVEFSPEETSLLRMAVEQNRPKFTAFIIGQILKML